MLDLFVLMKRAVAVAAVAIGLAAAIAGPAQAEHKYTYGVGGEGGGIFGLPCSGNDVMVGFHYRAGKAMDAIQPICQGVLDGNLTGPTYLANWAGGSGGGDNDSRCPPNQVITALHVWWDDHESIHHVRATCKSIIPNVIGTYLGPTKTAGGIPLADAGTKCPVSPALTYATGLTGYSDNTIHKLGLQCDVFTASAGAAATPPTDDTDPGPAKPTPPAPAAATRTVATATTLYSAPGVEADPPVYLQPGDSVTIKSCADNGAGWCSITQPQTGFVWGGDLNP